MRVEVNMDFLNFFRHGLPYNYKWKAVLNEKK
jgi:hypothetical protein